MDGLHRLVLSQRYIRTDPPSHLSKASWKHGEIWSNLDELVIELGQAYWFGLGALHHQRLNLARLTIPACPLMAADNGLNGLLGIIEPFWWNSDGFGVQLLSGRGSLLTWNGEAGIADGCEGQRPAFAKRTGLGTLRLSGEDLSVRLFFCRNAREVVEAFWDTLPARPVPPLRLFEEPLWSTWACFKNEISQESVLDFARRISEHGLGCALFGIDAKWQKEFGDTDFDAQKFPDPRAMVESLNAFGFPVTVWTVPFFVPESSKFAEAAAGGSVIRDSESAAPYLGKWWEGVAAFLDLSNPHALEWYMRELRACAGAYNLNGFKFDAGEGTFYAAEGVRLHRAITPHGASQAYLQAIAADFPWSDVRTAWQSQHEPVLLRQWDKSSHWGFGNGLASCITQTIVLNLLGYPYSFADMVGGNEYGDERVDEELLIRWMQAVAPMPFVQCSIPPWRFGDRAIESWRRSLDLHRRLAPVSFQIASARAPIVRPVWWLCPEDRQALECEDQYLVGEDYLVAPVLVPGARSRAIYFPPGRWRAVTGSSHEFEGPGRVDGYPAPLEYLPIFRRVDW